MKSDKRLDIYGKFKGHCAYCGLKIKFKDMQVDHIIPKSFFHIHLRNHWQPEFLKHLGDDDVNHIDNLFPSCRKCNGFKKTFPLHLFRSELEMQVKRTIKTSTNYRFAKLYNQVVETPKPIVFYFEKGTYQTPSH